MSSTTKGRIFFKEHCMQAGGGADCRWCGQKGAGSPQGLLSPHCLLPPQGPDLLMLLGA